VRDHLSTESGGLQIRRQEKDMTKRGERKRARDILKGAILLIPNFLKLLYRLLKDKRVPKAEKVLLIGAIIYVISPLDLIPDLIPFVGQVDDLYLVALTLLRLLNRTRDEVLREHWDGGGDIARVVERIALAAQYVLPKRIRQILIGRVEVAPRVKGGVLSSPASPDAAEPILRKQARR
jgi:uncharacterized membrane protein YkvA (DUF1232 family)